MKEGMKGERKKGRRRYDEQRSWDEGTAIGREEEGMEERKKGGEERRNE